MAYRTNASGFTSCVFITKLRHYNIQRMDGNLDPAKHKGQVYQGIARDGPVALCFVIIGSRNATVDGI